MSNSNEEAVKELLYKMADDLLVLGHRMSEWTGIGPVLEEDIAFASIAQDKVGQAYNLYQLLHKRGEADPDTLAFKRGAKDFRCSHLVEQPIGDYAFSLLRHYLFDHAEVLRYEMLSQSTEEDLADLAKKFYGEVKYHVFHGDTWVKQLSQANEESKARMQTALNETWSLAQGIFEQGPYEEELSSTRVFAGEEKLKEKWLQLVKEALESYGLSIPEADANKGFGGRKSEHTEHLHPLLEEMNEVISSEEGVEW